MERSVHNLALIAARRGHPFDEVLVTTTLNVTDDGVGGTLDAKVIREALDENDLKQSGPGGQLLIQSTPQPSIQT